jgi:hypothetical protein
MRQVRFFESYNEDEITNKVNNFLRENSGRVEIVDIEWKTCALTHSGYMVVCIKYKEN